MDLEVVLAMLEEDEVVLEVEESPLKLEELLMRMHLLERLEEQLVEHLEEEEKAEVVVVEEEAAAVVVELSTGIP